MKIIVCNDGRNGMMFNNRRQSRDSLLIDDIIDMVKDEKLYCSGYTSKLFDNAEFKPEICESTSEVPENAYLFAEHPSQIPDEEQITQIIRYLWNRHYPSDAVLPIDLSSFKLESCTDFVGNSHEKITKEIYIK